MPKRSRFYYTPPYPVTKTVTFTGASGLGATGTATTFFTVTGQVLIALMVPFCTDDLTEDGGGDSTLILGVTGSTALFIAATDADLLNTDTFWVDNAPDAFGVALPSALADILITGDILVTFAGVDDTDGGTLRIDLAWIPFSPDANVVPA